MQTSYLDLYKILDIEKWQRLQDSLAQSTKLAIITVDYKGIPVTTHSCPRSFCQYVRKQPELLQYCFKCDSRGGLDAVRLNAPYIYLCHCNILDLAVPIMIDGKYIGAVMAGEVRLPPEEENRLEKILISTKALFTNDDLVQMYRDIPMATYAEVQQSANMLFEVSNYIVEEAINKNMILEMYSNLVENVEFREKSDFIAGYSQNNNQNVKKAVDSAITNAYIKSDNSAICKNPVLRPAFDYIYENKGGSVMQKQMANLCHISASHFSRLFVKEVGEGFSTFYSRLKVQWSKQLLEQTDLSIAQISERFGFTDSSYYIKIFRKYESITPAVYRKYYQDTRIME